MTATQPHYLLFSETRAPEAASKAGGSGRWKFVVENTTGSSRWEAEDEEPGLTRDRLELLAVVRGLEALPEPARVTLVTASRYVSRGLRFGLAEWRESDWQWERFGQMSPIPNADLWQRLDRAARIHQVQCRTLRFDAPHGVGAAEAGEACENPGGARPRTARRQAPSVLQRYVHRAGELVRDWWGRKQVRAAQLL